MILARPAWLRFLPLVFLLLQALPSAGGISLVQVDDRGGAPERANDLDLYMDREELPTFAPYSNGRIVLHRVGGGGDGGTPSVRLTVTRDGREALSETQRNLQSHALDFEMDLRRLGAGDFEVTAELLSGTRVTASATLPLRIVASEAQTRGDFEIRIPAGPAENPAWPLTFGVPFPWGAVDSMDNIRILDSNHREVPYQATVTGTWSRQGGIRWLLIDFLAPITTEDQVYHVQYGPDIRRAEVSQPLRVTEQNQRIQVDTGVLRFEIPTGESSGITRLWVRENGGEYRFIESDSETMGAVMIDAEGREYLGSRDGTAVVEESGPIRAVIKVEGYHRSAQGDHLGRFITRYTAWRGLSHLQIDHTFIFTHDAEEAQYANISYRLPFASSQFAVGLEEDGGTHSGRISDDGFYVLQRDDLQYILNDGDKREVEGRLQGWFTTGDSGAWLTASVRDFWQKFPKEIEIEEDQVHFHFWPRHGEPPLRHPDSLEMEEVNKLWFAHEGEILDLRVPERVVELFARDTIPEDVEQARVANPTGAAVTHQILLSFHTEPWSERKAVAFNELFQQEPIAIPDPVWLTESGVFGWLLAQDKDRFPQVEKAIDLSADIILRYQEMDRDYGMFNFGDSHHGWNSAEERWSLHRAWYNTHHGWNRWPWIIFARSGNEEILQWARRNSRFAADMAHTNYAPERFRNAPLPRRKILGGIKDYKGLVHWNRGDRFCYNSSADALFWHYYLTGDRRSLSTAMNHARGLLGDPDLRGGRAASGRSTSAIAAYWHTWDNDYLEFFERHIRQWLDSPPAHPQNIVFAPSIERYIELTESSRAKQMVIDWAEFILTDYPSSAAEWYDHHRRTLLAYAYLFSGDERFLQAAAKRVHLFSDHLYLDEEDPRYHGQMVMGAGNLMRSYFLQQAPYYLYAVDRHGEIPPLWESSQVMIRSTDSVSLEGRNRYVFRAKLRALEPGNHRLTARLRGSGGYHTGGGTDRQDFGGWMESADGERVEAELLSMERNARPLQWDLEVTDPGDYELIIWSNKNFYVFTPVTGEDPAWGEVYRLNPSYTLDSAHRFYFNAPSTAREVALQGRGRDLTALVLYNPEGEMASEAIWLGHRDQREHRVEASLQGHPREGWAFEILGYRGGTIRDAWFTPNREENFYFSSRSDRWFQP